jgi:hypothetical protein
MHRTEIVSEVTQGAETENTVRETYVEKDMVTRSHWQNHAGHNESPSQFQTLNTSSENDPCYCESPAKYSSTYLSTSVPGIFEIAARHHSSWPGSRVTTVGLGHRYKALIGKLSSDFADVNPSTR